MEYLPTMYSTTRSFSASDTSAAIGLKWTRARSGFCLTAVPHDRGGCLTEIRVFSPKVYALSQDFFNPYMLIPCGLRVFSREIPRRDDPRTGHVWLHVNGLGRNYWGDRTETQTAALPLQGEDALQGCYFFTALTLAHLALVAALMRARPAAEMWRLGAIETTF